MAVFLLTYFTVYGGLHLYLWWKVRHAFRLAGAPHLLLIGVLLFMLLGPILSRYLDRWGYLAPAKLIAVVTYTWMAVILWFAFLGGIADLWNAAARLVFRVMPSAPLAVIPPLAVLGVIGVFLLGAGAWGLWEAWDIRLTRITVPTRHLAPGSSPLRIVQISDLHLGLLVGEARLRKVVKLVTEARPDILVSTGDLVDGAADHLDHLSDLLAAVHPPLGAYAVTGNHEFYAGLAASLAFHRAAGFRVLRGESVAAAPGVLISGVDDPAGRTMGEAVADAEEPILAPPDRSNLVILLKHRPAVRSASVGHFDLQLSGHTHRGQIWPFTYLVRLAHPRVSGFFRLAEDTVLFISRGTGTWGPPLRLASPPEVTLLELEPLLASPGAGG